MKRILGVDLGDARTGLAISDELQMLAHPLETISASTAEKVTRRIIALAVERELETIVIGLPRHMNGALGERAERAQKFADALGKRLSVPIVMWDERWSSVAAERALHEAGRKTREMKGVRDQVAAQFILQGYLDRAHA